MDKHDDSWLVATLVLVASGLGLIVTYQAHLRPCHVLTPLSACESNLKNMGTALEMYSTDWSGRYPTNLRMITPNYLKTVPTCPKAGIETYTPTYRSQCAPDAYTLCCYGFNHVDAGISTANYPQYTAIQGLIERP
ncbi:MAG: hypothetical protein KC910_04315 [Candidatus Eremiobacteraeota bacterium]|nr:hypothetical protein [Candidatus Eremiobacteraeota bacterium]